MPQTSAAKAAKKPADIKKAILKILFCWIPYKPLRRQIREFFLLNSLHALSDARSLKLRQPAKPSLLLIEPNPCHSEVLPGMVKYAQDLGYDVSVLLHEKNYNWNPFCRFKNKPKIYMCNHQLLRSPRRFYDFPRFDRIILNTSAYYTYELSDNYSMLDRLQLRDQKNVYVIEHDQSNIDLFAEQKLAEENRLITLGRFAKGFYVNPHYFGEVKITPKNPRATFIVVGGLEAKRKNHRLLIDAVQNLVSRGITNFEIIVVGKGTLAMLPASVYPYISYMGYLDFSGMYKAMEKADFFLPLLDPENPEHDRYITTGVTGSTQLIYGFAKLPVMAEKFADFYGFNDQNAVLYAGNNLESAMQKAIELDADTYRLKQQELQKRAKEHEDASLQNMKKFFHKI